MANVKWCIEFVSQKGNPCRVDIYDNNWPAGASAIGLIGAADPFSFEEDDTDNLVNDVLRFRTGYINVIEESFGALNDLHPDHSTDLFVSVSYDDVAVFNGFLQAQSFSNPYSPGPNVVSIPIVSPLGVAGERTLLPRITSGGYTGMKELSINTGDLQNYLAADGTWATATTSDVGRFVEITPGSRLFVTTEVLGRVALVKTTSNIGGARADFATGCGVVSVSGGSQTILEAPSDAHYIYVAMKLNSSSPGTTITEMPSGAVVGVETIGSVMKEICTALGITAIIIPKALLQDNVNPMHVYVSKRVLSPYNPDFNFGENDLFTPISYEKFLEGICNLYGLIAHDTVDSNGDSVLTFAKVGYTGKWLKMAVSTLDDTSVAGTEINQPSTTFFNGYDVASADGQLTYVRPKGRLDIDYGDKIDKVDAALDIFQVLASGTAIQGFHAIPLSDGGEFLSQYLVDTANWNSEYSPTEGDVVGLYGDGEEKIGIKYRSPRISPPSFTPLFEYIFSEWPRTKFDLLMKTQGGLFSYRVQIESGGKYASDTSTRTWVDTPTFLSFLNNSSNEYIIQDIPPTNYPVIVRVFPNPSQSSVLDIAQDPVLRLALTVREASPMNKYFINLESTIRTIKHSGEDESMDISCLFHDYYDNLGRIIGGSLLEQDEYSYLFSTMKVLKLRMKRKSALTLDMSRMYLQDITIDNVSGWRVLSVGFDPWNDNFDFALFKVADASTFSVTTDFENVTSDAPSRVDAGASLSVTLSGVDGNKVQENSVVVMMGGVDITAISYAHSTKTINIANVTGNISITAVGRPYDAEVEYLQSYGNEWIDTQILPSNKLDVDIDFLITQYTQSGSSYFSYLFGSRHYQSSRRACFSFAPKLSGSNTYWYVEVGQSAYTNNKTIPLNTKAKLEMTYSSAKVTAGGEVQSVSYSPTWNSSYATLSLYLFSRNNLNSDSSTPFSGRVYKCKIKDNNVLVRDLIPVKNNNVGYMYDKVSGQLFGNASGSGAFTYGNDVTT